MGEGGERSRDQAGVEEVKTVKVILAWTRTGKAPSELSQ